MKILAHLLDLTNAIATLDNSPFNGYTFEFTPAGELENTFLWRNGQKLDIENNPLILPKQPLIVEASFLEEIELPNEEFEYHLKDTPFTGTALFFIEGKLTSENTFEDGTEIDPDAQYHSNGFLQKLNENEQATGWFSNGAIRSQYFKTPDSTAYLIRYDELGLIISLGLSLDSPISYPLIDSKKFSQEVTIRGSGITDVFLFDISQRGALQDTKKLLITNSNISVDALIKTPLQQLERLKLEDCPDIEEQDIEVLRQLYPNTTIELDNS